MTITKTAEGSTLTFVVEGRLDTTTAPELEAELMPSLKGVELLVMDFEKLDYISSAGLRLLLNAQKELFGKGKLKVIHANEIVKEVFEVTGLTNIMDIQ